MKFQGDISVGSRKLLAHLNRGSSELLVAKVFEVPSDLCQALATQREYSQIGDSLLIALAW